MAQAYRPPAKCSTSGVSSGIRRTGGLRRTWWFDVRDVLGLTQEKFAAELDADLRTYQRWEAGHTVASLPAYLRARELLAERQVDSRGRILAAKAVGA